MEQSKVQEQDAEEKGKGFHRKETREANEPEQDSENQEQVCERPHWFVVHAVQGIVFSWGF
jgi:hypothetical protein